MFGMLDYRAYKLLWLIELPFRLIYVIALVGSITIAIMIGASLDYSVLVRIVIACAIFFGVNVVIGIIRWLQIWFITKGFFWLIDVVPAKADNVAEAKAVAIRGPMIWLDKKFLTDFGNWTEDDTEEYASLLNWRARLFFHSTERIRQRHLRFREMYEATGKQPGDLTEEERQKLTADLDPSWFAQVIINPYSFYGIAWIIIISIAIISLDDPQRYKYPIPWDKVFWWGMAIYFGALLIGCVMSFLRTFRK